MWTLGLLLGMIAFGRGATTPCGDSAACVAGTTCCACAYSDNNMGCALAENAVCCGSAPPPGPNPLPSWGAGVWCPMGSKCVNETGGGIGCEFPSGQMDTPGFVCKFGAVKPISKTMKNAIVLGDSVSIGYEPPTAANLSDIAMVQHTPWDTRGGGAGATSYGQACLDNLLRTATGEEVEWDLITFNFGLHNLDNSSSAVAEYKEQLENITDRLIAFQNGRPLLYALTTPFMPDKLVGNHVVQTLNEVATGVMQARGIPIADLYSAVTDVCGEMYVNCSICRKEPCSYHYNPDGYEIISHTLAPAMRKLLTSSTSAPTLPQDNSSCATCEGILAVIQAFVEGKIGQDVAEAVAKEVCLLGHGGFGWTCEGDWACNDLCSGIVKVFGPEFTYLAGQIALEPERDCKAMGFCTDGGVGDSAAIEQFIASLSPNGANGASEQVGEQQKEWKREDVYRVVHLTDVHWDQMYEVGAKSDCGEPLCCRSVQGKGENKSDSCGYWGDQFGDTNNATVDLIMETLVQLDFDGLITCGDEPAHNVWNQTREANTQVTVDFVRTVSDAIGNKTKHVAIALGNHNGLPVSQFNTSVVSDQGWLYDVLAEVYEEVGWMDAAAARQFQFAGFYSSSFLPNIRTITIPDNLAVPDNYYTLLTSQMTEVLTNVSHWLEGELAAAAQAGDGVFILGHHPPNGGYHPWLADTFTPLLSRYSHTVKGTFWGHTHESQIQLHRDVNSSKPIIPAFIGPAPTPHGGHFPSFRIYTVNKTDGTVLDFDDYNLPINSHRNQLSREPVPQFQVGLSALKDLNLTSLSPQALEDFANKMRTDDALFHRWEIAYQTGNAEIADFSASERLERVCDILSGTSAQKSACKKQGL